MENQSFKRVGHKSLQEYKKKRTELDTLVYTKVGVELGPFQLSSLCRISDALGLDRANLILISVEVNHVSKRRCRAQFDLLIELSFSALDILGGPDQ